MRAIAVLVCMAFVVSPPLIAQGDARSGQTSITVVGYGVQAQAPDGFVLSVSISETRDTVSEAQTAASEIAGRLLPAVKVFDLDLLRSHSDSLSVRTNYEYNRETNKREFVGYAASQQLRFHLNQPERAEELVLAVLAAGVKDFSTDFVTSQHKQLRFEARRLALLDALETARSMTDTYGLRLGHVIDMRETEDIPSYSIFGGSGGGSGFFEDDPYNGHVRFPEKLHWMPPAHVRVDCYVRVTFHLLPAAPEAR